jgi:radical SAM superfamily enzyme YgiQ (UPF0313 family)
MIIIFNDTASRSRTIGAYRMASALRKKGIQVEVIDHLSSWSIDKLIELLSNIKNVEWVGFSLPFLFVVGRITKLSVEDETKLLNYFRQKNIPIILGGSTADRIKNSIENFWISIGYSDISIYKFHEHLTGSKEIIFEKINNNNVIYADRDYKDIDLGDIDLVIEKSDLYSNTEIIPIEIGRGCIFKCAFCNYSHLGKKPGTYIRPKECIKKDISNFQNNFNISNFMFVDDTFNDSVEKMRIIKEIRQELHMPFNFWAYGRLDLLAASEEQRSLMGEIGWTAVTFGIETLNRQSGRAVGKGADPEKLKQCLLLLKKMYPKLHVQINLIVGLPHSTREDIKNSVDWLLDSATVDYLRIQALAIRDPTGLSFSSSFSKDPTKYGYKTFSSKNGLYWWANDMWNSTSSVEYTEEIQTYLNSRKPLNISYNLSMTNFPHKEYIDQKTKWLEELYPTHEYLHT